MSKVHEDKKSKTTDRSVVAEMVSSQQLQWKNTEMKSIVAVSAPLGPKCPGQSQPGPPQNLLKPVSLGAPASKLRPQSSLLA